MDLRTERQRELDQLRATQADDMLFLGVTRETYGVVPGPVPTTAREREILEHELRSVAKRLRTEAVAQEVSESEPRVRAQLAHKFIKDAGYPDAADIEPVFAELDARRTSAPNAAPPSEKVGYALFVLFAEAVQATPAD